MATKRRNTMLLVVGAAGLLAVIAGVSQLPFLGRTAVPPADPAPALALPKAEHVVVSSVDSPVVDITAAGVLVNGKRQPVVAALQALETSTKPSASGFRRAVLRSDASTDAAIIEPVLAALQQAGYDDVVAGVQATGPCLSATDEPLGSACQLAVDPLQRRNTADARYALVLHASGYTLSNDDGFRVDIPNRDGTRDLAALRSQVLELRRRLSSRRDLEVSAEAGVKYGELVTAMDLAIDEGFTQLALTSEASTPDARSGAREKRH